VDTLRLERGGVHDAEDTTTVPAGVSPADGGAYKGRTDPAGAGPGVRAVVRDDPWLGSSGQPG